MCPLARGRCPLAVLRLATGLSGPLGGAAAGFYESGLHVLRLSDELSKYRERYI